MRTELRLLGLVKPYRVLLGVGLVTTFLASLLDGFTLVILIPLLKHLFGTDNMHRTTHFLGNSGQRTGFLLLAGIGALGTTRMRRAATLD